MTPTQLQRWRRRLRLSQAQLARELGVDVMTISRWERGERGVPPYLDLALRQIEQTDQRERV